MNDDKLVSATFLIKSQLQNIRIYLNATPEQASILIFSIPDKADYIRNTLENINLVITLEDAQPMLALLEQYKRSLYYLGFDFSKPHTTNFINCLIDSTIRFIHNYQVDERIYSNVREIALRAMEDIKANPKLAEPQPCPQLI